MESTAPLAVSTPLPEPFFSHSLTSLTVLTLAGGLIANCCSLLVFSEVPKLLRSTVNTLIRNLFLLHITTTLVLGSLVTSDWIAWTHNRVDEINQSYFRGYRRSYPAICPLLRFTRGSFICATFGVLWVMALDRAMTILYPRSPHTILLKRHPSLATITVCALAPLAQSYYLVMPRSDDLLQRDCVDRVEGPEWRLVSFAVYLVPLLLLMTLFVVLVARLRSAPAKSSTRNMNRIVFFVILLTTSYTMCTAPHKVAEMVGGGESIQRVTEALLLFPGILHPLLYYIISENFRKAVRRCLHRRRHLGHRRQCRHPHDGPRHTGDCSAVVTLTEMTTAFSVTSEDTTNEKTSKLDQLHTRTDLSGPIEQASKNEDPPAGELAKTVSET